MVEENIFFCIEYTGNGFDLGHMEKPKLNPSGSDPGHTLSETPKFGGWRGYMIPVFTSL